MRKILIISLLILVFCGCNNDSTKTNGVGFMEIDTSTVYNKIDDKNFYIIDVRETFEYEGGHIKNAYNIPLSKINDINKMMLSLDSKIVVYCQSGNRSRQAANLLVEMGYTNVYDMGGVNNWNYELVKE